MKTTSTTHLSRMILNTVFAITGLLTICVTPALGQGTGGAGGGHTWLGTSSTDFFDTANWNTGFWPNGIAVYGPAGGANTTIDRSNQTYTYQYGIQFTNTTDANGNYTLNGTQAYSIQNYGISTTDMTSGTLNEVINPNITNNVGSYNIGLNHDLTLNGIISSPQDVVKNGVGTMTLNGINTYVSDTIINAGTLKLGNNSALGTTAGATTISSGAALDTGGFSPTSGENFTISGTGTDGAGGTGALYSTANSTSFGGETTITLAGDTEIGGGGGRIDNFATIDGGGFNLTKVGTENWYNWSGSASNIDTLIVDTGAFMGLPNAALANAASNGVQVKENAHVQTWATGQDFTTNWTFENGSKFTNDWNAANASTHEISGNITLNGTVEFGANSNSGVSRVTTLSGAVSGSGSLVKKGFHELVLSGVNSFTGDTSINAGSLKISGSGQLGSGSYAGAISNSGVFEYNSTATQTLSGVISGAGTLEKDNTGTLTLSANNTYTGATSIEGGKLLISGDNASTEFTVGSGATLELASGFTIKGASNGSTIIKGDGALLVSGNVSGQADSLKMQMNSGASIDVQANITYGSGSDEWTGNLADLNVDGGIYGAANDIIANSLTGNGSISMGSGTIVVGVDDGDGIFNGNLSRNYADAHVRKEGSGTQTLNGSVNMGSSGTVTVSGGTLVFNGTSSGSNATGSWTVENGATLSGSGTLSGTATIGLGGILSPGNSPGTQTFDNLVWENGGTYLWEINADSLNGGSGTQGADPGWDWINVTSDWDISGITTGFNIDITSLTNPGNVAGLADGFDYTGLSYLDPYESFTILSFGSLDDTFDASLFTLNDSGFSNPKVGWSLEISGNDLVLNAVFVPEPSSTALLGLGGLALMLRRKRS